MAVEKEFHFLVAGSLLHLLPTLTNIDIVIHYIRTNLGSRKIRERDRLIPLTSLSWINGRSSRATPEPDAAASSYLDDPGLSVGPCRPSDPG